VGLCAAVAVIEIRVLGELRVARDGAALALPASRRTRALLGYLAATGRAHTRQGLCDLLWDGPDDPRAELRWSLTKLRHVVDQPGAPGIEADRERVALAPGAASIDASRAQALLADGIERTADAELEEASDLLQDEFMLGLELASCYRFHAWCMAERERYRSLRVRVARTRVERAAGEPARALALSRRWIAADPLAEAAHASVVRLLATLGRVGEAQTHCRQAESMFRRELGAAPAAELREAAEALRSTPRRVVDDSEDTRHPTDAQTEAPSRAPAIEPAQTVGRAAQLAAIEAAIAALAAGGEWSPPPPLLLFVGEPGIGKSHLLGELALRAAAAGCRVLSARCFEAEMTRPYGCLVDALRDLAHEDVPAALAQDLGPLLPGLVDTPSPAGDRTRLFDAAASLFAGLAGGRPVALLIDDLQWADEGSASLLHFVARRAGAASVLLAGAARAGELEDNPWARALAQSLARSRRLTRIALEPLDPAQIALLIGASSDTRLDPRATHRASGGNPLLALALTRAHHAGADGAPLTWQWLVDEQVERLDDRTRELVAWAAVTGREFRPELLAAASGVGEGDVLERLARLERRELLRETSEGRWDFAHDLLREAVYRGLSAPRRRAIHRQVALSLEAAAALDPSLYAEVAHHGSQAGDHRLTVRACLAAAEHCLRVFANTQALAAVDRCLASLERLPSGAERTTAQIAALKLRILAGAAGGRLPAQAPRLASELAAAIDVAQDLGLNTAAASGLHMLSWLTQQGNDIERTRAATLRAERASRGAGAPSRCTQLANSGRCLLEVEQDLGRARDLIASAALLADEHDLQVIELEWGRGLVDRHRGDLAGAERYLRRAVELARLREDHWREFECQCWLAAICYERREFGAVVVLGDGIAAVAARMSGVQAPLGASLQALAQLQLTPLPATDAALLARLDASVAELRSLDDQAHLAYVQNLAALVDLQSSRPAKAAQRATEALAAAQIVNRDTEIAVARAILACSALGEGRRREASAWLDGWCSAAGARPGLSARAALHLVHARDVVDGVASVDRIPMLVPTLDR
jgi:DNA-binding SARP family transcriptional activator